MDNDDFMYWLSGFFNLSGQVVLTTTQIKVIINHLNLVKAVSVQLNENNQWLDNYLRQVLKGGLPTEDYLASISVEIYKKYVNLSL